MQSAICSFILLGVRILLLILLHLSHTSILVAFLSRFGFQSSNLRLSRLAGGHLVSRAKYNSIKLETVNNSANQGPVENGFMVE